MKLIPRTPPGRTNRRARAFGEEIARLRCEGYGYVAIQEALADAGVIVSKSTVQREVARMSRPIPQTGKYSTTARVHTASGPISTESFTPPIGPPLHQRRSGRDVAEAFMKGQITNPLFRSKEPR